MRITVNILILSLGFISVLRAQTILVKTDGTPISEYYSLGKIGDDTGYGYANKTREGGYALIDSLGNPVTSFEYDKVDYLKDNNIIVLCKNKKYGFFDKGLNEITPYMYDDYAHNYYGEKGIIYVAIKNKNEDGTITSDWGVIDAKTGKEIIPCRYSNIRKMKDSFYRFCKVNNEGIRKCGVTYNDKEIVLPEYSRYLDMWDGEYEWEETEFHLDRGYSFIQTEQYGNWGVIDSTGCFITPISFKKNFVFETDRHYNKMRYELGLVSGESEEYFINPSSKKKQYVDRYAVINHKGQLLTPFKYESTYYPCLGEPGGVIVQEESWITKDGYRSNEIVCDKCQKKWNYYYLDSLGREAMKVDGDLLYEHFRKSSKDTITVVSRQTENGVVYSFPAFDALQNPQPTLEYNDPPKDVVHRFEESGTYNIVRKESGKIGLDSLGHTIIPAIYEEIQELDDDYYIVKKNDKYALADKRGNFLTPFDYFEIRRFTKDLYRINKGVESGRYGGLINKQGTLVLFGYRSMEVLEKEQIILASDYDGRYSLVNLRTGKSFEWAEHIVRFSDKAMLIKQNNRWGLVDLQTEKMIIPTHYNSLVGASDYSLIGKKDINKDFRGEYFGGPPPLYKYGVLDSQGNEIIPFEYEEIIPYYGNLLILKKK